MLVRECRGGLDQALPYIERKVAHWVEQAYPNGWSFRERPRGPGPEGRACARVPTSMVGLLRPPQEAAYVTGLSNLFHIHQDNKDDIINVH